VMWVANEIERDQIREYAETLHFAWTPLPGRSGGTVSEAG
jgi:hypothetical protein